MGRWLWRGALVALALFVYYQGWVFAHILWWRTHPPAETAFMAERLADLHEERPDARLDYRWVPYGAISANLKRAVVAAEDGKFLDHDGFDWEGIQHAYEKNLKKGRIVAGGSTISQQLAKNLFLSSSRTPWRKAQEALITVMLEAVLDKRRLLELYLNVVEWGNGLFGAEAAARHYFGVSAAQLSPSQAARLAAMLPNPRYYDDHRGSKTLAKHAGIISARLPSADIP